MRPGPGPVFLSFGFWETPRWGGSSSEGAGGGRGANGHLAATCSQRTCVSCRGAPTRTWTCAPGTDHRGEGERWSPACSRPSAPCLGQVHWGWGYERPCTSIRSSAPLWPWTEGCGWHLSPETRGGHGQVSRSHGPGGWGCETPSFACVLEATGCPAHALREAAAVAVQVLGCRGQQPGPPPGKYQSPEAVRSAVGLTGA